MEKLGANPANSCPLTPLGFLERAATVFADCPSPPRRCLRLASALASLGVSRRDVVSVLLPNVPAMYEAHFGVPMSGAVLNTINTRLDARTVAVLLRHSGSRLVFVDPALLPLLDDALRLLPPGHAAPRVVLVEDTHDHEKDRFPPAPAKDLTFPWGMAALGGTNVCLRRVDARDVYSAITDHGVTHLCGAPVVLSMLANAPEDVRRPLPGKIRIMTAGSPPPAAVLHRAEALGFEVSHGYGLTETGGHVVSCAWKGEWNKLPASERARLKARQGVRTPGMAEVDILDGETGRSVPRDGSTMGEIVLRGGCVMLGYLNDSEATKAAIRDDGWFYTGDVGVMHPDGYLEIRDRSKDVIISGGENISSVEVESMLYGHPAVSEAAVVARPDEFWGETPCAFVSLKEGAAGAVTAAEVIAWSRKRMAGYMVPKTVVFSTELPKTSTGKVQKYVLRKLAREMGPTRRGSSSKM
ncbi:2-succinylbenzoate--CoA ligase [Triticum urartu]|uniref:2-succinylbenzoate--CoA ligase n=1 Tax=Triticum urartu TaxID=4572 RepID=M8ASU6_TRIUA|nr:2-succinylbenzoate--CoA ligase [Triticum urartu]